jgi:serine/threonine protein kinase
MVVSRETMELPPDIDGFVVEEVLGEGSFATVYRVRGGAEELALKLAHGGPGTGARRLEIEAAALRDLHHPGIPRYVSNGVWGGRPYLVMSLVPGRPLSTAIRERDSTGGVHGVHP